MGELGTATWLVRTVAVQELQDVLNELEQSHPPASLPMVVYIDISRVLVLWRYWV